MADLEPELGEGISLVCTLNRALPGSDLSSMALSWDGGIVATGYGSARLWSVDDQSQIRVLKANRHEVQSVALSPYGEFVATGGRDGTVRLWDLVSGQEVWAAPGFEASQVGLAFSPDGSYLAMGATKQSIKILSVSDGSEQQVLRRTLDATFTYFVAFYRNQKLAAGGGGSTTVWNSYSWKELYSLRGIKHETVDAWSSVSSVAFSSDGKSLATGTDNGVVQIVDATTGRVKRVLDREDGRVFALDWSEGHLLAGGFGNGKLKVWNMLTEEPIVDVAPHSVANRKYGHVYCVRFLPDGKRLATAGLDGTVKIWQLNVSEALTPRTVKIRFG